LLWVWGDVGMDIFVVWVNLGMDCERRFVDHGSQTLVQGLPLARQPEQSEEMGGEVGGVGPGVPAPPGRFFNVFSRLFLTCVF